MSILNDSSKNGIGRKFNFGDRLECFELDDLILKDCTCGKQRRFRAGFDKNGLNVYLFQFSSRKTMLEFFRTVFAKQMFKNNLKEIFYTNTRETTP